MCQGLAVRFLRNGTIVLEKDMAFTLSDKSRVIVGRGYESDGATIPRLFWRVAGHPLQMPLLPCAVLHDALYESELLTRYKCDREFLHCMESVGIGEAKRRYIYLAVRLFGWLEWNKNTTDSVAEKRTLYVWKEG